MLGIFCTVLLISSQVFSSALPRPKNRQGNRQGRNVNPVDHPFTLLSDYRLADNLARKNTYHNNQVNQLSARLKKLYLSTLDDNLNENPKSVKYIPLDGFSKDNEELNPFNKLFDKNGMLYLTKPKVENQERKINKLMNKVINYKIDVRDQNMLRKPLTSIFTPEEILELKQIVKAIVEDGSPVKVKPNTKGVVKTEYDFSELVNRK